ncbi:Ig-like domain-containing protein [Simiduia sp. 21SJ11W-1]|uniref:Ig-like domain-containing protein n=1 Tax=Simiduia sp. 21SJ11W-1 TaxID=2909669 RepID=UPI0020A147D3|nr:Ig-like domain-containing protein [Simiduia sp. 21SJ11W-1]UTA49221.1 Ig-like domain-containing protein [Simiduia sp. 21SJ11W-1]
MASAFSAVIQTRVMAVQGEAWVTDAEGVKRPLTAGEIVELNEWIATGAGAVLVMSIGKDAVITLGQNETLRFDKNFLSELDKQAEEGSLQAGVNFDALEQAIEEGRSLDEVLPAAAAGGDGTADGSAGTGGVRVDLTAERVTPESGFETSTVGYDSNRQFNDIGGRDGSGNLNLPDPVITINPLTVDDVINAQEQSQPLVVSGDATNMPDGSEVLVTFNGNTYVGVVNNGSWSATVPAADMLAAADGQYQLTAGAGNTLVTRDFSIDSQTNGTINFTSTVTPDNSLSPDEATGTVTVAGNVTGDFNAGDQITLTVNGVDYLGTLDGAGNFAVDIAGSDLQADADSSISASFLASDSAGNTQLIANQLAYQVEVVNTEGSVTVTGTPQVGEALVASVTDVNGAAGAISYQWFADGVAVNGATSRAFTLSDAEVGKTITVQASYTDDEGFTEAPVSAATSAVVAVNDGASATIAGIAQEDETLTATVNDPDGASGAIAYQWYADGVAISGATGSTYTLTDADVGKAVTVQASYTDDQGFAESPTSAATSVVAGVNDGASISITGTALEDETLTATVNDPDGANGAITYQWYADGVAIGGATGNTYTLTDSEVGKAITVQASYTDDQGFAESPTSAATSVVAGVNDGASISITGTALEDETLTATVNDPDGANGAITYQWFADGVAIGGATNSTYTLTDSEVGKAITVQATYTDDQGFAESPTSAATAAVAGVNDGASVSITGTALEDETLTATVNDPDGASGVISYQWYADGVAIGGATGNTYTLTDSEVGKAITVQATYTDDQGFSESPISAATAAVAGVNDGASVSITGTAQEDEVLTATVNDPDGASGAITYQWFADGVAIGGATNATYTLTDAEVGKAITVQATYTDDQGFSESPISAATAAVAGVNDGASISITGTALEDETLTATVNDPDGANGAITYQWFADGVAIGGATGNTYTLTDSEVGKAITVQASYTDDQGFSESPISAATAAVAGVNDGASISITGTALEDETLTATVNDPDGANGAITYQWFADGVAIGGATGNTYTLTDSEVGKAITVQATYTDDQGFSESPISAATAAVAGVNDGASVSITGTALEDETLTATVNDPDGANGAITYQWFADGVAIGGATGNTYTLTDSEVGKAITVQASYTDDQGFAESPTSAATAAVAGVNDGASVSITGTALEDETLTATVNDPDGANGAITYQWFADGVAIGGATNATYTLTDAEVGKAITVQATYTDDQGFAESPTSAATAAVAGVNDGASVSITGTALEDETLTATVNDPDGASGVISYQWYADGVAIGGATGNTYTLTDSEVGKAITVQATYTDDQGFSESPISAATAAVAGVNDGASVSITGTAQEDEVLTATVNDPDGASGAITYQWFADGVAIGGATNATYTLTDAEVGKAITVQATYTDDQGFSESPISAATAAVAGVNDGASISITGTALEDETLTATVNDPDGANGAITYQWFADGVAIGGATGNTYTLTDSEVGKAITVQASYTDDQGFSESPISAATAAVAGVNDGASISITGTALEDETLTATVNDPDGANGAITYQWFADGVAIGGATGNTYTLTDSEVGKAITVQATYTDDQGFSESPISAATAAVAGVNDGASVSITGTALEDETLTATVNDPDGANGAITYQWFADGVAIGGATGNTYTLTDSEVGKAITVQASYTDDQGFAESPTSAATAAVAGVNDGASVSITGTALEDETLTATVNDPDGANGAITYQWFADGVAIGGATNATYTLTDAEVGKAITVQATYTDDQGFSESPTSAATAAVAGVNDGASVSITGTALEDETLTATVNDPDGASGVISYQWYADGVAIGGATGNTYTLTDSEVGKAITVQATYTDDQGFSESPISAATAAVAGVNDGASVSITGTALEDETLTATVNDPDGANGAITYQWFADGVAIGGATNATYTLTDAEVGKAITVQATYTDDQGFSESPTSAATAAVAGVNDGASVSITGTALEDETLTATVNDPDGANGAITYQWFADGVAIGGATNATYTLTDAEVGKAITVQATYTDDQGFSESPTSAATAAVAGVNDGASVSITGTALEDETLTATVNDPDGASGVISYQWYADGVAIGGATGNTYTLTDREVGKAITVQATYTDDQGFSESPISAATAAVAGVNDGASVSITGTAQEDEVLTATVNDPDGASGAITYQWFADGVAIGGATNATYTLTDAEVGKAITVQATYTDDQGFSESPISAATAAVAGVNDGASISITGTALEDETLTATVNDPDGANGAITYQWFADGVAIGGATGNTYTLTDSEVGKAITVQASYTDDQGFAESPTSVATAAVAGVNDGASVSITGTAQEDEVLTATVNDPDGASEAITYQWFADGVAIGGATNATYTLTDAEVGKAITVQATYTDDQGFSESPISAATAAVAGVNDGASVSITGTALEDETLTATVNDPDGANGAITYQWYADGVAIGGATGNTYTLTDSEVGKAITVQASYTDDQGFAESPTSAATSVVAGVNDGASISITGTALEDETLTATVNDPDGANGAITYQWFADGVAIGGATNSTYTLTDSEVGKAITVQATYTDDQGFAESPTSAATAAVAGVNDGASVSITGTALEDETLTATVNDPDGASGVISYQWYADGVAIGGATGNTYTLTDSEVGKAITVQATYTDDQGFSESPISAATAAVAGVNDGASVSITGTALEDETLTATVNDPDGANGAITYQWFADGVAIGGATGNTYTLTDSEVGKAITVQASYTDDQGFAESPTSVATAAVAGVNDGASVSITGTAQEDEVLTATVNDPDGASGAITYQWFADGVAIGGATNATYTLTDAEVGKAITVQATYTDDQGFAESPISAATAAVAGVNDGASVSITGTAQEDEVLTATVNDPDGASGAITYQWFADGVAIGGATNATYTLTDAEVGKAITVQATYTDDQGFAESPTSAATSVVAGVNDGASVSITGTAQEDEVLTATVNDPDGASGAITYQWFADGVAIGGATNATYTLTDAEVGKAITVQATYTDDQGFAESPTSAATSVVAGVNDGASISITGTALEDETLTATVNDPDGASGAITYQWFADGVAIGGATNATYTLTDAEVGKAITVQASYTDDQGFSESPISAATAAVAGVNDGASVSITGTALEDETLTATVNDPDGANGAITYQWFADGVAIGGATNATYTLTDAEVGKAITVQATYTDDQGFSESPTSAATAAVAGVNDGASVSITGTALEDETLTATVNDPDGASGVISYQWYADGVAIGGATGNTYTLTDSEVGKAITVQATYTDDQGFSESPISAATAAVAGVNDGASVSITGTAQEDEVLTATVNDPDGASGAITYQWFADGVAIGGATNATYTLTDAEVGKAITVQATYTDDQGFSESPISAATAAVAGVNDGASVSITGTALEDETLTATVNDPDGANGAITYQWFADGVAIGGATGNTYTLTDSEVGKAITVQATYTDDQGFSESPISAATAAVAGVNDGASVSITGTAQEDEVLTATVNDPDGASGAITYQWFADGVAIGGATNATYTLTDAEVGKAITVQATYTDDQGFAESPTSAATSVVAGVNDGASISITGTALEDETLTATVNDPDGANGAITYQWFADGVAIGGATNATYTLTDAEVGKAITVQATYTDDQGFSESPISAATAAVAGVNDGASVSITGTALEDETLTATVNDPDGANGAITYQWFADGVAIGGATGNTYTLTDSEVGKAITVQATYTDDQGFSESPISAATAAVAGVNDGASVSITGTALEDETLTATVNDPDGANGAITYQWFADGVAIGGATNSTYTLTDSEVGKAITVQATYTDDQGFAESPTSAATAAVAGVNDGASVSITGTALEDETLTATVNDPDGASGVISYQWYADGVAIGGATGNTYTLTDSEVGKAITVQATYTDDQGFSESPISAATAAVAGVNDGASVSITGTALEDETLTATVNDPDGANGAITYQWFADGVAIGGATGNTYTLTDSEVGKAITVQASYTDDQGFAESPTSVATAAVAGVNDGASVSITGTAQEDEVLTATVNDPDGASGAITYQWFADGVAIGGATNATYTLTDAEVGKAITVQATYTDDQGFAESPISAATAAVAGVNDGASVSITGTAQEDEVLTATVNDPDGASGAITYQWFADGVAIGGATNATYTLTDAEVGKAITVQATYTDDQGFAESPTSAATSVVAGVNDGASVSITGTAQEDEVLTATVNDPDGASGAITYQWFADGVAIGGATNATYTLTDAEVGKAITVQATYTDDQGFAESPTSAATSVVAGVNDGASISITGTALEDETLTATVNDPDGASGAITYQWFADGVAIGGATNATYTLTDAEVGKAITVQASYTDDQGFSESPISAATAAVAGVNDGASVSITGTALEDETLTATVNDPDGANGAITYQWFADGVAIGGATNATYTLTDAEVGKAITVQATYTDDQGFSESPTSAATAAVAGVNDGASVSITGTALEDETLTATVNDPDGASGVISYQWYADGVAIGGATGNTYTLTDSEVGKAITVQATYTDDQGFSESPISAATAAVAGVNDGASVSITGTAQEDEVLTATVNDPDGASGAITYQWFADGVAIGGATNATYTLTDAEVGKAITVQATYTDDQGFSESPISAATAAVAGVNDGASVSITGTALEDETLTATVNDPDGANGAITYQWFADGVAIGGATGNTYTLTDSEVGKAITVQATYTDDQGFSESPISAATAAVAGVNDGASVSITGTAQEDEVLTATVNDPDGASGAITYQWFADGVAIGGATNATYTLTDAEVGKAITVQATYTDDQGFAESPTSAATSVVAGVNDGASISITGTALEDETLTATVNDPDGANGAITYQWFADGVAIGGATNATYTLTDSEVGKAITVQATYTDDQGFAESPTSAATAAVAGVNDGASVSITGTALEDETLTATVNDPDGASGVISYQWYADGVAIGGATGNTYTLTDSEVGKAITVQATYTDDQGFSESPISAATAAVAGVNDGASVSITGTAQEDEVLTATVNDPDGASGAITYQWFADGVAIGGATNATYTLTDAEVGKAITVQATYTDDQGFSESPISAATAAVAGVNDGASISITGTALEDETLTATVNDPDGANGAITYQWFADGVAIGGATGNTYTLTDSEVGKAITVQASYTDDQGFAESPTSVATAAVAGVNDGASVSITGTAQEDEVLTATVNDPDGASGAITYQWFADGVAIGGATNATYTLTDAEVGKAITVQATYTDDQGFAESPTSAATSVVAGVNDGASISITGTALEDETLTATVNDPDGANGAITYQWFADGVAIGGATNATYTLTDAEVGKAITVQATYTDDQGFSESPISAATAAVAGVNDGASVSITGTAQEDEVLTATVNDPDGASGAITYQWFADGVAIGGATNATYTLTDAEVGKAITVQATYTDDQGFAESPTSAATSVVAGVNDGASISITGTALEDETLTATVNDPDGASGAITYQWFADGVAIGGATNATYTLTDAEVGKAITVQATYTDDQGFSESPISAATAAVAGVNDGASISITGTALEDETLTATVNDPDGANGAITYQWFADGVAIGGATGNTYTLTDSEVGKAITVQASYTDDQGFAESPTSPATNAVININDVPELDLDANDSSGATGSNYQATFTEGGGSVRIADSDVVITDQDNTQLTSARVQVTNFESGDLLTVGALPSGITASAYNPSTGVLTLSGAASLANYQQAIRAVQFTNDGSASGADKLIQVSVFDGSDWSNVAQSTINMVLIPTVSVGDVSVQEPQSGTTTLTFTINIDTAPASDLSFTYQTVSGSATGGDDYVSAGPATATIAAGTTSTTVTITINSDSNVFEGDEEFYLNLTDFSGSVNFAPGSQLIAGGVKATGSIGANNGAPVAENDNYITGQDQTFTTGNVLANDTLVDNARIAGIDVSTTAGTVINNGDGTFTYTPAAGFLGTDSFSYTLIDDDGETDMATVTIDVSSDVVTPPTVANLQSLDYEENASPVSLFDGVAIEDSDSSTLSSVVVTVNGYLNSQDVIDYLTAGTNVTAVVEQAGSSWQLTLSGGADIGEYITVLESITYFNSSENPSSSTRAVSVEVFDQDYANISNSAAFDLRVMPVNDAPTVFDNDRFVVEGTAGVPMNIQAPTDVDSDDADLIITVTSIPDVATGVVSYADGISNPVAVGDQLTLAQLTTLLFHAGGSESIGTFTYEVFDGELTAVGTTTLSVGATQPDFNTVYESGLPSGSGVEGQSATATGNLFANDGSGGGTISSIDFDGASYTASGGVITVTTPLGVLSVNAASGNYTYQLNTANNTGGDVVEQFTYNFTNGVPLSDTLDITIVDDVPIATNVAQTVPESEEKVFNLVFSLDISTSMNAAVGSSGDTRLSLAKQALVSLAEEYFNQSTNVTLTVLLFANGAHRLGTFSSFEFAQTAIESVTDVVTTSYSNDLAGSGNLTNSTSYVDALTMIRQELTTDLATQSAADGVQNVSYFLSDGAITADGSPLNMGYREFMTDNAIKSYGVGIGDGLPSDLTDLNYVHNIDSLGRGYGTIDPALIVSDVSLLQSELLSTVPTAFGGNITQEGTITRVSMGADGGYVSSIDILLGDPAVLHTISYDGAGFNVTPALASGLDVEGTKVTLNADDGFAYGTFTMDFATGSYLFIAPNGTAEVNFQFDYTVLDGDGDSATATAKFNIVDDKPDARDDLHTAGHYEEFEGNVVTGLGTDGGPALGSGFTPFAAQGGGVDKVVDNAKVTSFSYKGQEFSLDLAPIQQVGGQSESVTLTSQTNINNANFSITATRNSVAANLAFSTTGNSKGVGVVGADDKEIDAGEVLIINWDTAKLPYGATGLILEMGKNFDNSDLAQVKLFDVNGVELSGSPITQYGTNDQINLSNFEGIARIEITSIAGNGFTLNNIAYSPVYPVISEPDGSNGTGLSWTYGADFDLDGNQVNQVTVTDADDGSVFIMRSNGYYNYTPGVVLVSESFTDNSADQGVTATTTANGNPVITYNGANGLGVNSDGDAWDDSADAGDNIILSFDTARYPDGVEAITLVFGFNAGSGSVTFYDSANNVLGTVALTGSNSQTFTGYSGVSRLELDTGADGDYSIQQVDFAPTTSTSTTTLAPNLIEYTLTDSDGQSDTAQLALYTIDNRIAGTTGNDNIMGGNLNDAITGGAGNDTLHGGAGHDSISGGDGVDTLSGGLGNDYLAGGAGDDEVYGNEGDDHLAGDAGNDLMDGGIGADILIGGEGDDRLFGGADDDKLYGGTGNDQLYGGSGNDLLLGEAGDDLLNGGTGDDTLFGGEDQDTLQGGEGNDVLFGGRGDDTLTGGNGADTFAWARGNIGTDTVTDFTASEGDVLDLSDLLVGEENGSIEEFLQFNFDEASGNTYINVDADGGTAFEVGQVIILQGVDITAGNTLTTQQVVDNLLAGGSLNLDT